MKIRARPGFTLLEILLALALIGLIAGALIGGSVSLLRDKPTTPDEVFWQTVLQARKAALEGGQVVRISWDDEHKALVVDDGSGSPRSVPVPGADHELAIDFVPSDAADNSLIAGVAVATQRLPFASFYPDGTCSAFQFQIRDKGAAHLTQVDPWTCAPVLKPPPSS